MEIIELLDNWILERNRMKSAVMSHGIPFTEWTAYFKGLEYHLFTGKTIRKELSKTPFSQSFIGDECHNIISYAQEIFPENIWVGTEKEKKNYAKILFSNTDDTRANREYLSAYMLYKDKNILLNNIFSNITTANSAMSLCTFAENDCIKSCIYSINAIAIEVHYKDHGFRSNNGKNKVIDILKNEHFGKTIPEPTFIIDEDCLTLVFVFENPVYIYKHADGIRFFEWINKVFADKIKYLGAIPVKINGMVKLEGSAIAKGRDKYVRCETKWIKYSDKYTDASRLRDYLMSKEELSEKMPWYRTKKQLKNRKKINNGWDPTFKNNTKNVLEDLVKIRDTYNNEGVYWYNNKMLFIYCVAAIHLTGSLTITINMANEFKKGFCNEISYEKVIKTVKCVTEKQYKFRNKTILGWLGIKDGAAMGLKICRSEKRKADYIKQWKHKKSTKNKVKKEKQHSKIDSMIVKMRKEGKKNKDILSSIIKEGISMSISTLERFIGKLIKDGKINTRIKMA